MKFHLFQYPIPIDSNLDNLNRFLASHRIVADTREIVNGNSGPVLLFIVETALGDVQNESRTKRIDYRELLSAEDFLVFNDLRTARKVLADKEGVPVFSIFNNAQLAEMVTSKASVRYRSDQGRGGGALRKIWGEYAKDTSSC